jgi:hypothetical protein
MAGHSASEDARSRAYVPAIDVFDLALQADMDARDMSALGTSAERRLSDAGTNRLV